MHKYLFIKHTKAMKKLTYLAVAAVALGVASCNNSKPGYVITGTVEGASDGDTVFIQERVSRQFNKLDTAIIANGTFTFEGVQDSAVNRYITYSKNGDGAYVDFFLENGKINVNLSKDNKSATGTRTMTLIRDTEQDQCDRSETGSHLPGYGRQHTDR